MNYSKLLWAILGTVVYGVQTALSDNHMDSQELVGVIVLALGAFVTWRAPNTPVWNTAKTWVNAVAAGAVVLQTAIIGGVSAQEWWSMAIAVLTTAGVYMIPNGASARPGGTGGTAVVS